MACPPNQWLAFRHHAGRSRPRRGGNPRRRLAHRRASRPRHRDRLGPDGGEADRRHLGGLDDRLDRRGRHAPVVHGRPLRRRVDPRPDRRAGPPRRRSRPLRGGGLPPRQGLAADRPGLLATRAAHRVPAAPLSAGIARRRLATARVHLDRAAEGHRPPLLRRGLEPARGHAGRRLRLRHRPPRRLRPPHLAQGRAGRRRRCLLRDPRLLPPGRDRRPPLRGRRDVLDLEPGHPARRAHGRGHLPQPDLVPPPHPRLEPARVGSARDPRRHRAAPRLRGAEDARERRRGRPDPAARGRSRGRWART